MKSMRVMDERELMVGTLNTKQGFPKANNLLQMGGLVRGLRNLQLKCSVR